MFHFLYDCRTLEFRLWSNMYVYNVCLGDDPLGTVPSSTLDPYEAEVQPLNETTEVGVTFRTRFECARCKGYILIYLKLTTV